MVVVDITPTLAKVLLDTCNLGNRPLSEANIRRHAYAMTNNLWQLSSQGLSIAKTGELNNGQHRLWAVIRTGKTIKLAVVFGEDRSLFMVHDDSMKVRGGSDTLATLGYTNTHALSAAARLVFQVSSDHPRRLPDLNNRQLVALLDQHPDLPNIVSWGTTTGHHMKTSQAGMNTAAYLITRKYPAADVQEWYRNLRFRLGFTSPKEASVRLIDALEKQRCKVANAAIVAALTIKAWNSYRLGKNIRGPLHWLGDEAFPEVL